MSLAASWVDFAEHAPLFAVTPNDVPENAKAQNDHLVAQRYAITPAEFAHLLRSFKVMAGKRPEYLTLLPSNIQG